MFDYSSINDFMFFEKMYNEIPKELISEGKKLTNKQIEKYIKQIDEIPEKLEVSILEDMLHSDFGQRYGTYLPFYFNIKNESDFHLSFAALMFIQMKYDLDRNIIAVNQTAWFMLKKYGNLITKYGDDKKKAFFVNNIKLLKLNRFIID